MNKDQIPQGYFDALADRIAERIDHLTDDLNQSAPLLEGLKYNNPYKIPEGYFTNLPKRVLSSNIRPKQRLRWVIISAAACIMLLIGLQLKHNIVQVEDKTQILVEEIEFDYYLDITELDNDLLQNVVELEAEERDFQNLESEEVEVYLDYIVEGLEDIDLIEIM